MTNQERLQHEFFMARCIELAKLAKANGESPVGSIIVKNNEIIGEGIEAVKAHRDITYHAEIEAIRVTQSKLQPVNLTDAVMYSTHEPCIMCAYVIRHHKIGTIVVGIPSKTLGGYSSPYPLLLDNKIHSWAPAPIVIEDILSVECRAL